MTCHVKALKIDSGNAWIIPQVIVMENHHSTKCVTPLQIVRVRGQQINLAMVHNVILILFATHSLVMDNGRNGLLLSHARQYVGLVSKLATEHVQILLVKIIALLIAMGITLKESIAAIYSRAQRMKVGVAGQMRVNA